jgi:DNA gyrase subunit B
MGYSADNIVVLSGLEPVRRRPEMYIGPVDSDETMSQLVEQVLCSSLDEAYSGRCSRISVELHADGAITVEDDSRGMSLQPAKDGVPIAQHLMTELYACRVARQHAEVGKRFCGAGIAVVNALSEFCTLEIRQDGRAWAQEYREGNALTPFTDIGPASADGTRIVFKPDTRILPRRVNPLDLQRRIDEISREVPRTRIGLLG